MASQVFRRRALSLAAAAALLLGAVQVLLEFRATLAARPTLADQRAFLAECAAAIPEEDWIHLVAGPHPELASVDLYPRRIRAVPPERLEELRRSDPGAWVVRVPIPFDRTRAFLGHARDLP